MLETKRLTVRQELVWMAAIRYNTRQAINELAPVGERKPFSIADAIEAVIDECKGCKPGTLGAAMLKYYRTLEDRGETRLKNEVWKAAKGEKR